MTCSVESCNRDVSARGYCTMHYQRLRRLGTTELAPPPPAVCTVPGCGRAHEGRGYCSAHNKRRKAHGDVLAEQPVTRRRNGSVKRGYRLVWVDGERMFEHRAVMAAHLGRALCADEVVHHKNGDKLDNRIENLELWTRSHPSGQRIEDVVEYAAEMLSRYAPERLAPPMAGG